MANSVTHAALPYPVKGARYTLLVPYLDSTGTPTDPGTPDTEISVDAVGFADCAEEVATITGSNGMGYITLTGDEMNGSMIGLAGKVASGPKTTLATLYPRVLPILESGTAQAGNGTSITLAVGASSRDLAGCILRTTGGTGGGGGSGNLNNQARIITAYNTTTKVATVEPAWETNPANGTTYDVLITEIAVNAGLTVATIADGVWDEDIVAAHGTADTAGRALRVLMAISDRTNRANLEALLGVPDDADVDQGTLIGAVWDVVLTGLTHNVTNSSGRILRQLKEGLVSFQSTVDSATPTTVTVDGPFSGTVDFYKPGLLVVEGAYGVMFRRIESYDGAGEFTVSTAFVETVAGGDTVTVLPWASVRVSDVDAGVEIDANVVKIDGIADAADALSKSAPTIVRGAAVAGTLSTTQMTTDLAEATDSHYIGRVIIWTSGVLRDQASRVTGYTGAGGLLTFSAATEAPGEGDGFVIV